MAIDASKIKFIEYDFYLNGENRGYTKMDQTATEAGLKYTMVDDTAQFQGIVAAAKTGAAPTLKVTMYQTEFESIFGEIAGDQMYPVVDGAKLAYGLGSKKVDLLSSTSVAVLHPSNTATEERQDDIMYWKVAPKMDTLAYAGKRDGAQEVTIEFFIFPDSTKSLDMNYGLFGDWTAVEADPFTIFLNPENSPRVPYNHEPAITMTSGMVRKQNAFGFYKTDSTTVTAALNEAGNITATDVTYAVDTIAVENGFAVGDYVLINSEVHQITGVTPISATAATWTVDRHIGGSVAAGHTDDDVITKLENVFVLPITRRSTWASSVIADLTVGDSDSANTKGIMTWVSDGSSNVTANVGATTSPNTVVTTTT